LSQSTVSHRLSALERELGVTLISRGKGIPTIELTQKGEAFVPIAQRWLSLYQDTNLYRLAETVYPLCVAAADSLNAYVLYKVYNLITDHEKKISLTVRTCHPNEIYDLLEKRAVDVGFTYVPLHHNNFCSEPLFEQELMLVERSDERRKSDFVHPSELDTANEVFGTLPSYAMTWHDNWFDPEAKRYACADTALLMRNVMNHSGCWCVAPELVARFMIRESDMYQYHFLPPPPKIVCYKATYRFPKPSTMEALAIFERYLRVATK